MRRLAKITLALLISSPALGYDYAAHDGTTYSFDIPPGYYITTHPDGIKEGLQLQLSSSPDAKWDNPIPDGSTLIVLGFWPGRDHKAAKNIAKGKENFEARGPQSAVVGTTAFTVIDYDSFKLGGYVVVYTLMTNNGPDAKEALKVIAKSLKVTP